MRCLNRLPRLEHGITLLEMVIVIAITAVIAGALAVFISRPIESYADATRRADLTDVADTALRRMTRELRTALPNSVRVTAAGGNVYLEFLQTTGGARYRAEVDNLGNGNILDFSQADPGFDVIGAMPTVVPGDRIVVYNLAASGGVADAYGGDNVGIVDSVAAPTINLAPSMRFPFASPGNRFHVVQQAVTYECNPAARTLSRYWNYGIVPAQPTPPLVPPASVALLAGDIQGCAFTYNPAGASGRVGVVGLQLQVQRDGEVIQIFQQVHVSNAP